jgi:hypothetical protein
MGLPNGDATKAVPLERPPLSSFTIARNDAVKEMGRLVMSTFRSIRPLATALRDDQFCTE